MKCGNCIHRRPCAVAQDIVSLWRRNSPMRIDDKSQEQLDWMDGWAVFCTDYKEKEK